MPKKPELIDSAFRHILIAARRAEQLISGARPRVESRHVKPTTIALAEMVEGEVPWRSVTAEEYEALRLQELEPEPAEDEGTILVRPTAVEPEAELEPEADDASSFEEDFQELGFSDEDLEEVVEDDDLLSDDDDGEDEKKDE